MGKIEKYLLEIQSPNVNMLPPKIIESLLTDVYPFYFGKTRRGVFRKEVENKYGIGELKRANSSAYSDLFSSKKDMKTAKILGLVGILSYGNGDHAFLSLKHGDVYIWSHDVGTFTHKAKEYKNKLWQPMSYKKWVQAIKSGKMNSAFKK